MYKTHGLLANGFYQSFSVSDLPSITKETCATPEQQAYNRSTYTCPKCKGAGVLKYKERLTCWPWKREIVEAVGCPKCLGVGKLPKERTYKSAA